MKQANYEKVQYIMHYLDRFHLNTIH